MKSICNERNVIQIVSNDRYIAVIGCGITILERATFAFVHRFAGIRHIHGGTFLDDDVLAVFTGEQRLYFFQISEKKLLWECPRPSQLAPTGDMQCCSIPSVNQIVCIAEGNQGLEDHVLLLVDYQKRTYTLQNITSCRRVASSLVWNQELGVTLLSYEATGHGDLAYSIAGISDTGAVSILHEWKCSQCKNAYSGKHLFLNDNNGKEAQLWMCEFVHSSQEQQWKWSTSVHLPIPFFKTPGPVGAGVYLPYVSWVDETLGLLTANTLSWICVCDFHNQRLLAECNSDRISCGLVLDGNLLIGTSKGVIEMHLDL